MVYAIEAIGSGFVKFGVSADVNARLRALQLCNPHELAVRVVVDWPELHERHIHRHLEAVHVRGEWFRIGPQTEAVIAAMRAGTFEDWMALLRGTAPSRLAHHIAASEPKRLDGVAAPILAPQG